jgi:hypothetical protein
MKTNVNHFSEKPTKSEIENTTRWKPDKIKEMIEYFKY